MSDEYKTYCSACSGSGFLYVGTGHRMRGYPFAEKTASSGRCYRCDNWNKRKKPMTEQELADYWAKLDSRTDAAIAFGVNVYAEEMAKVNERRKAAGLNPL